jgi:hypothetical protein
MKTYRSMKAVLGIVCTALTLSFLSVFAIGAELPDQALSHANPRVQGVMAVQEAVTPDLMAMPDVLGTAVGQDDDGELTILVYVNLEGKNPAASAKNGATTSPSNSPNHFELWSSPCLFPRCLTLQCSRPQFSLGRLVAGDTILPTVTAAEAHSVR